MEQNTQTFKVYRDNKLSYIETYKPILHDKMLAWFNKLDYFIVNNRWPVEVVDDGATID